MLLLFSWPAVANRSFSRRRARVGWAPALLLRLLLAGLLFPPLVGAGPLVPAEVQEYELKAVYLYNFLHFVYWPAADVGRPEAAPVGIGVVGESPFGSALSELQGQLRQSGRGELVLVEYGPYRPGLELRGNQLLFVAASERDHFPAIIAAVAGSAVLTVADVSGFLEVGGMIALVTAPNGKIGWRINRGAVQRAGLQASAKLLQMAVPGEAGHD